MDILDFSLLQVENFTLIFGRVVGFMAILPIFGSMLIPQIAKVGLSFMLSIIVASVINVVPNYTSLWEFGFYFSLEIMIGVLIGFVCYSLIYSAAFAGELIDTQNSLSQTHEMDPIFDIGSSITGELFFLVFSLTFLYIGGHLFLIEAVIKSFDYIAIGGINFLNKPILDVIVQMFGYVFIVGFKIAAPIYSALIVVTVVLGLISKSIPQINVMILGMPIKIGVSFIFTIFALPIIKWIFEKGWYDMEYVIVDLIKALGQN